MNENLEKQLALIIEKAISVAEKTGEFAMEQAPDLLREFILFHRIEKTIYVVLPIILTYAIFKLSCHIVKKTDDEEFYMYNALSVLLLIVTIANLSDFIKVWIAPKLFLIEYFIK